MENYEVPALTPENFEERLAELTDFVNQMRGDGRLPTRDAEQISKLHGSLNEPGERTQDRGEAALAF
jgi:hypothetical protein